MSGSENGRDASNNGKDKPVMIPPRSASPAKRSAIEMEDGSSTRDTDRMDMHDSTLPNSMAASSIEGLSSANTSATSFQVETSPALSPKEDETMHITSETVPSLEEQVSQVHALAQQSLEEGDRGVVVSSKWLVRVLARTSEGCSNAEYPKEAREGDIGPLDNSDIVQSGGFSEPMLKDRNGAHYIPLKDGLSYGVDYEVLPYEAYGKIVGWYGSVQGQRMIVRYAHNTADAEASSVNMQYEVYPPVITIRKLPIPKATAQDNDKSRSAVVALKMKQSRRSFGQMSPDDAVRIVSSRVEKYQKFLLRAKEYAGITASTKVHAWRCPDADLQSSKLVITQSEFDELESTSRLEPLSIQDHTTNDKYNGSSNMDIAELAVSQTLLLVEQTSDLTPQRKIGTTAKSTKPQTADARGISPAPGMMTRGRVARSGRTRGTVGLSNLGNTCYMNSALQCIRSVEELAIYFLMNQYKKEINASNPIGYKGAMATRYAEVVRAIYNESASGSFSPSGFKSTLAKHAPIFSGFGQQDSQEFLSFLVDALHEDLNRITKKPFLENPDSDDNRVNDPQYIIELGNTYRDNHRARNDSIAMDLFSGFYKNTMECPECDKVSVTFDPYSSLTLQLPMSNTFTHGLAFVPLKGQPVRHEIDLDKNLTLRDLKKYIASKHANVDAGKLWITEVYGHKTYKLFEDSVTLAEAGIQNNDWIFVFELEYEPTYPPPVKFRREAVPSMDSEQAAILTVPVYHRRLRNSTTSSNATMVLHPQYISLSREEAKDLTIIRKKVLTAVAQLTSRPILLDDEDVKSTNQDNDAVSEHSEPSDEDYVKVGLDTTESAHPEPEGDAARGQQSFMDSSHEVSDRLSDMLFKMNYAKSSEGGHCASMQAFEGGSVREMSTRVKLPSRRSSIDTTATDVSEALDDESTNGEDAALSATGESPMSYVEETIEEEGTTGPSTHRKNVGKGNKFKSGKKANKEKALAKRQVKNQRKAMQKELTPVSPFKEMDDNPYYIRIGECIILDWHSEAFSDTFEGKPEKPGDSRGVYLSEDDGIKLPIFDDPDSLAKRAKREHRKKHGITLEDCFAETGKREKLSEDNAWYCNRCKELRQATKTLEIWTLPDILVLHLKRFGGNRRFNDKIDVMVDYPVEGLELSKKVGCKEDGKEYIYDLFAIDNHFGGLGGGHYTAIAKNFFDGAWYDYNDSSCTKQGEAPRKSAAAYLLFYRQRSDKPLGPQYLQDLVHKFRNPDEGEESDSGEGSLDGLSSTLHGSSSNSLGAGVTATKGHARIVDGDGSGHELNQKTTTLTTSSDDKVVYGPAKPVHLLKYRDQTPDWGFEGLDDGMQLDDNDSMQAEADADSGFQDAEEEPSLSHPWNDTETQFNMGDDDSALHLEDAGTTGEEDRVHDIILDEHSMA